MLWLNFTKFTFIISFVDGPSKSNSESYVIGNYITPEFKHFGIEGPQLSEMQHCSHLRSVAVMWRAQFPPFIVEHRRMYSQLS